LAHLAPLHAEADDKRAKSAEDKEQKEAARKHKKAAEEAAEKEKAEELAPILKDDIAKGVDHIMGLKLPRLKEILMYHYFESKSAISKLKKADLQMAIRNKLNPTNDA
jgi:hypothetical protein